MMRRSLNAPAGLPAAARACPDLGVLPSSTFRRITFETGGREFDVTVGLMLARAWYRHPASREPGWYVGPLGPYVLVAALRACEPQGRS